MKMVDTMLDTIAPGAELSGLVRRRTRAP